MNQTMKIHPTTAQAAAFAPERRPTIYGGTAEGYRDHLLVRAMDAAATPEQERHWTRRAAAFDRVVHAVARCPGPERN